MKAPAPCQQFSAYTYSTGEPVPVAYNPTDPADAQVADLHSTYAGPLFVGGSDPQLLIDAA